MPVDLAGEWLRLQFCATFGWTFEQYDAQDVEAIARAEIMLDKAQKNNIKLGLAHG